MPDPRLEGAGRRDPAERGFIHDLICADARPDERYSQKVSNANKVLFICEALTYPQAAFDLEVAFPIDDWLVSEDLGYLCAGLYLNDLREQFFEMMVRKQPDRRDDLFQAQAKAEFYKSAFHRVLTRKERGVIITDKRVLH